MKNQGSLKKRIGRFAISKDIIEENPTIALQIMGQCIVVRAETMWHMNVVEYVALSPNFDIIEEGYLVPHYTLIIDNNTFMGWVRD